jgi:hypothetical protein
MTILALALALAAGQAQPTIPKVSLSVDGQVRPMDTISRIDEDGSVETKIIGPARTMPVTVVDVPGIPSSAPNVSFDHPLVIENARTGERTVYDQYVIHREVRGVARDPIGLAKPRNAAEAAVGVCAPKRKR